MPRSSIGLTRTLRTAANKTFLRRGRDEATIFREHETTRDTARAVCVRALHHVEKPIIHSQHVGTMKPHDVIEARDLHSAREPRHTVWKERCRHERKVGRVR